MSKDRCARFDPITRYIPMKEDIAMNAMQHEPPNIEHYCAPVIHPVTKEHITSYKKLSKDTYLAEI